MNILFEILTQETRQSGNLKKF